MTIKSPLAYNQIDHSHFSKGNGKIDVKRTAEIRKSLMDSYNRLNNSPAFQAFKEINTKGVPEDAYYKNGKWIKM